MMNAMQDDALQSSGNEEETAEQKRQRIKMLEQEMLERRVKELEKVEAYVAARLTPVPGAIPRLQGIDMYGETIPQNGKASGDIIIYMNFEKRYNLNNRIARARKAGRQDIAERLTDLRHKGGILVADVTGHGIAAAARALKLDESFKVNASRDLDEYGEVKERTFEEMNMRFCKSETARNLAADLDSSVFPTAIYGEVKDDGKFRFISLGHPVPLLFSSKYDRFQEFDQQKGIYLPLGVSPTDNHPDRDRYVSVRQRGGYEFNDVNELMIMGKGDLLISYTDGFLDPMSEDHNERRAGIEKTLAIVKDRSAKEICNTITHYVKSVGPQDDDLTAVVIKYGA